MNNKDFLESLENELNNQIDFVVRYIQNMPEVELTKKPKPNGWSIVECLSHLNTYGDYYLPKIKQIIIQQPELNAGSDFKQSILGKYLNKLIHPKRRFIKLKAHKDHLPNAGVPSLVIAHHINQQEELLKLIRGCSGIDLTNNKIPVSVFKSIKLPVCDILEFVIVHNLRHYKQINAIGNFPVNSY